MAASAGAPCPKQIEADNVSSSRSAASGTKAAKRAAKKWLRVTQARARSQQLSDEDAEEFSRRCRRLGKVVAEHGKIVGKTTPRQRSMSLGTLPVARMTPQDVGDFSRRCRRLGKAVAEHGKAIGETTRWERSVYLGMASVGTADTTPSFGSRRLGRVVAGLKRGMSIDTVSKIVKEEADISRRCRRWGKAVAEHGKRIDMPRSKDMPTPEDTSNMASEASVWTIEETTAFGSRSLARLIVGSKPRPNGESFETSSDTVQAQITMTTSSTSSGGDATDVTVFGSKRLAKLFVGRRSAFSVMPFLLVAAIYFRRRRRQT
mmetsp:Transcript_55393/g.160848  ORF Transcript_55393/g.160848 Transcript_55393/m.160848 type:complete len:318 (+) Transcript_55393:86-1039(+)|eukprot:CAMPEP_0170289916 /NCGR_PEP_ID=MMETSP0116_2-20130129/45032_1 /TAXON_ID=400756 /ORGANISM="Durinskia baltica, Strain CSIRO CS-38" /LENGTH=317 /DNA_ID=CAMNT_0010541367 /DNA_START=40 /DNA_END=993 /DNA_ORIENTATION=-